MSIVLRLPTRIRLVSPEAAEHLATRQDGIRGLHRDTIRFLTDEPQERLPPSPEKGYSPSPGMANRTKK
jgi:hypothetical protein